MKNKENHLFILFDFNYFLNEKKVNTFSNYILYSLKIHKN